MMEFISVLLLLTTPIHVMFPIGFQKRMQKIVFIVICNALSSFCQFFKELYLLHFVFFITKSELREAFNSSLSLCSALLVAAVTTTSWVLHYICI